MWVLVLSATVWTGLTVLFMTGGSEVLAALGAGAAVIGWVNVFGKWRGRDSGSV